MDKWKFKEIDTIEEQGFNAMLESFVVHGINGLVRENVQNSLDARCTDNIDPIEIDINIGDIAVDNIPGVEELFGHIRSLKGGNSYSKETISHMCNAINVESTKYISFEDKNTKGLTQQSWEFYAYKKSAHYEEVDSNIEDTRGGSHGIGKIAANAASEIHTMYFANCDENGAKQIGGTTQLIEHEYEGKTFRATGYFTDLDENSKFKAYMNNEKGVFDKSIRGLKLVIPFLKDAYASDVEVIRSVCANFFVAIFERKLIVNVNGKSISEDTILDLVEDKTLFDKQYTKEFFTPLYISTYIDEVPVPFTVLDKQRKEYRFKLYFKYDENIERGAMSIIRTIGMKIEDFRVVGHRKTSYNAILIPESQEVDVFLKSLENESHTKLTSKNIRDEEKRKNAQRFINNLNKEMQRYIGEYLKELNPTDGAIDTSELIYSVENRFKKELEKGASTIAISNNGNKVKKSIVKRDMNKQRDQGDSEAGNNTQLSTIRKRERIGTDKEKRLNTFSLQSNEVNRLLLGNKEIIQLDLNKNPRYKGESHCEIKMTAIDGEGKFSEDLVELSNHYEGIIDKQSGNSCTIQNDNITDIHIIDGCVKVELNLKSTANRALKYIYTVEVC